LRPLLSRQDQSWKYIVAFDGLWFDLSRDHEAIWLALETRGPIAKASPESVPLNVWNPHGGRVLDSLPKGQKCNAGYLISSPLTAIRKKFSVAEDNGDRRLVIHANPARVVWIDRFKLFVMRISSYSADLAPLDFCLFGDVKSSSYSNHSKREKNFSAQFNRFFAVSIQRCYNRVFRTG
jgi:hypothetical protein